MTLFRSRAARGDGRAIDALLSHADTDLLALKRVCSAVPIDLHITGVSLIRLHSEERLSLVEATLPTRPLAASVVDTAFPIVAVVGLVGSRLFVARKVAEACSADELEAWWRTRRRTPGSTTTCAGWRSLPPLTR